MVQARQMAKAAAAAAATTTDDSHSNVTAVCLKTSYRVPNMAEAPFSQQESKAQEDVPTFSGKGATECDTTHVSFLEVENHHSKAKQKFMISSEKEISTTSGLIADLDTPGRESASSPLRFSETLVNEKDTSSVINGNTPPVLSPGSEEGSFVAEEEKVSGRIGIEKDAPHGGFPIGCATALGRPLRFYLELAKTCLSQMDNKITRFKGKLELLRRELKLYFSFLRVDLSTDVVLQSECDNPVTKIGTYLFELAALVEAGHHKLAPMAFFFYMMNVALYNAPDANACHRFIQNEMKGSSSFHVENEEEKDLKIRFGLHIALDLLAAKDPELAIGWWSQVQSKLFCGDYSVFDSEDFHRKLWVMTNLALHKGPSFWQDSASLEFAQVLAINGEDENPELTAEMQRVRSIVAGGGTTSLDTPTNLDNSIVFEVSRDTHRQGILAHSRLVRKMIGNYDADGEARKEPHGRQLTFSLTTRGYSPTDPRNEGQLWELDDFEQLKVLGDVPNGWSGIDTLVRLKKFPEFHFRMIIGFFNKKELFEDFSKVLLTKQFIPILAYFSFAGVFAEGKVPMILLTPIPEVYIGNIFDNLKIPPSLESSTMVAKFAKYWKKELTIGKTVRDFVEEYVVFGKFSESSLRDFMSTLVDELLSKSMCFHALTKIRQKMLNLFVSPYQQLVDRANDKDFDLIPKTSDELWEDTSPKDKLSTFLCDFALFANKDSLATKAFVFFLLGTVLIPFNFLQYYDGNFIDDEDNVFDDEYHDDNSDDGSSADDEKSYWEALEKYETFLSMHPQMQKYPRPYVASFAYLSDMKRKQYAIETALYIAKNVVCDRSVAVDEWVDMLCLFFLSKDIRGIVD